MGMCGPEECLDPKKHWTLITAWWRCGSFVLTLMITKLTGSYDFMLPSIIKEEVVSTDGQNFPHPSSWKILSGTILSRGPSVYQKTNSEPQNCPGMVLWMGHVPYQLVLSEYCMLPGICFEMRKAPSGFHWMLVTTVSSVIHGRFDTSSCHLVFSGNCKEEAYFTW